jgi:hypothetical protein
MWTLDPNAILVWLILAFCGGVFGAAVGALCSFVLCGLAAIAASLCMLAGASATGGTIDGWVTWGPLLGPQTAFVGGCWAAVYARYHAGFHNGRDICKPLVALNRPDVLLVGGIGGVCGAVMTWLFWLLPSYVLADGTAVASSNTVACGVAVASMIGRLVLGRTGLFGTVAPGVNRWAGNADACWLPWQHDPLQLLLIAVAVGLPSAFLAYVNPQTHLLVFGLMCVLFLFMILGQSVIAGHHFAICAFFAVAATGNVAWGLAFAILAGFACEILAFQFTAHGDSHIDPPTCGIMVCGFLQPLLIWLGVMRHRPLTGPTAAEALHDFGSACMPGGDATGLVALAVVSIAAPLLLGALRRLPPARGRAAPGSVRPA